MNCPQVQEQIVGWLSNRAKDAKADGFVVGVSGGIDSALVSKLCCLTGLKVILVELPINRKIGEISERATRHCTQLEKDHSQVLYIKHDLSTVYNAFMESITNECAVETTDLAKANLASRLRMCSLYTLANTYNRLVAGTGNKVEDFGVGFFTKYGDGGVDISPIGDLMKSEVRELAHFLGIDIEIIQATPTDELWSDTRSDEDQIGCSYDELEWAMKMFETYSCRTMEATINFLQLNDRAKKVLITYANRHTNSQHKMSTPPICYIPREYK